MCASSDDVAVAAPYGNTGVSPSPTVEEACLSLEETLAVMDAAQSIAITGHMNPDGDALGSALALRDLLEALGKEVTVLLAQDQPAPKLYAFLPEYEFVYASEYTKDPDLFIVVDASTLKRIGNSQDVLSRAKDTLVIDHHANYEGFANHYLGDTTAPAAATLIWQLIKASTIEPTLNMAIYCYVAIMTDTGRFAYTNTNHSAFADAVEMVDLGVDPARMSELVYEHKTAAAMRLEAMVIERVKFACNGSIAYSYIAKGDLETLGIERDATEQLPPILRSIEGVEVAALFRDEGSEGVRVNLRSRGNYNVGIFACQHGGGGHAAAAGLSLELPLEKAVSLIVDDLVIELSACN